MGGFVANRVAFRKDLFKNYLAAAGGQDDGEPSDLAEVFGRLQGERLTSLEQLPLPGAEAATGDMAAPFGMAAPKEWLRTWTGSLVLED